MNDTVWIFDFLYHLPDVIDVKYIKSNTQNVLHLVVGDNSLLLSNVWGIIFGDQSEPSIVGTVYG